MPEERTPEWFKPFNDALVQAFREVVRHNGMRTVYQVPGKPAQVKAYMVGQNCIRLDVMWSSLERSAMDLPD